MYKLRVISAFEPAIKDDLQEANGQWEAIKAKLKQHLGKSSFKFIIEPTKAYIDDQGTLLLKATNKDFRDFISKEYLCLVQRYWDGEVRVAV